VTGGTVKNEGLAQFFEINKFIFESLTSANIDIVSDAFLWVMVVLFLVAVVSQVRARWTRSRAPVGPIPSYLSALGVLGTFVGVAVGLATFDVHDLDTSIPRLLEGLKIAFSTSIIGMAGATGLRAAHHVMFVTFAPSGAAAESSGIATVVGGIAVSDDAHLMALRMVDGELKSHKKQFDDLRERLEKLDSRLASLRVKRTGDAASSQPK
jgi:hypothetical protein